MFIVDYGVVIVAVEFIVDCGYGYCRLWCGYCG